MSARNARTMQMTRGGKDVLMVRSPGAPKLEQFAEITNWASQPWNLVSASLDELSFWLAPNELLVKENISGRDLASFDLVYFKSHQRAPEFAASAANYLDYKQVRYFDHELATSLSNDKLSQLMRLAAAGLAIPKTVSASSPYLLTNLARVSDFTGWPLVIKEIRAGRGRQNYLVRSVAQLKIILSESGDSDIFLLQSYVENDGYLRVYIFGDKLALGIARQPAKHDDPLKDHLNNPKGSANANLILPEDVPAEGKELALEAAKTMQRQVAGVDVIFDKKSKRWLMLEVNRSPQLDTGSFVEEKLRSFAKFIDNELNK